MWIKTHKHTARATYLHPCAPQVLLGCFPEANKIIFPKHTHTVKTCTFCCPWASAAKTNQSIRAAEFLFCLRGGRRRPVGLFFYLAPCTPAHKWWQPPDRQPPSVPPLGLPPSERLTWRGDQRKGQDEQLSNHILRRHSHPDRLIGTAGAPGRHWFDRWLQSCWVQPPSTDDDDVQLRRVSPSRSRCKHAHWPPLARSAAAAAVDVERPPREPKKRRARFREKINIFRLLARCHAAPDLNSSRRQTHAHFIISLFDFGI